ncbi:reverse transcriptase domain-containing protein [Tanacetum coccineum]|uniref:Reverse transcriptase domain-containing protein n=1 Tax=Tanacetum coccineum TaxID=301880 RepID=A0ABQ5A9T6_9ASTR
MPIIQCYDSCLFHHFVHVEACDWLATLYTCHLGLQFLNLRPAISESCQRVNGRSTIQRPVNVGQRPVSAGQRPVNVNDNDQDSLNAAAGGNLLSKTTREALNIIENKSKVRYSRNKPNASRMNTTSRESDSKTDERIDKLADQLSTLVARNGPSIPTNPSPKKVVERETEETTDKEQSNFQGSTAQIPPPVTPIPISEPDVPKTLPKTTPIPEPDVPKSLPKPHIPYPSRLNQEKSRDKASNQKEKIFQMFQDFCFDISFADALLLMPRFAPTIKSLLMNKEKLLELAKIPLNENCSAMLLKKLPEKLGDPDKFLIPCNFPGMDVCHALADLGASINLMPLSIWKKLSLPDLTPTRMTLELAPGEPPSITIQRTRRRRFCQSWEISFSY